jgi:glucosamine 6-phosphate synthetase-like amidotransferase/phosphosugar isomerase protein
MCGIVGYIGYREAYPIVIKGLKRLEYRGYDSAGVMLYGGSEMKLAKTKGKVSDLEEKSKSIDTSGTIGIGHTRWATHGVPNDVNSHPHFSNSGDLAIIHNGIIENYAPLKVELVKRGYVFQSDTDTEVLVNLIEEIQKKEKLKLGKAVQVALNQVVGAYAIAVFDKKNPDEIVVARLGSPLAIGIGDINACSKGGCILTVILQNSRKISYINNSNPVEFSIYCETGIPTMSAFDCGYGITANATCDGAFVGKITVACPNLRSRAACALLVPVKPTQENPSETFKALPRCNVKEYDEASTTC